MTEAAYPLDLHHYNSVTMSTVPDTLSDALDCENPVLALRQLSLASHDRAVTLTRALQQQLASLRHNSDEEEDNTVFHHLAQHHHHPVHASTACAESILHSLTKIASGGSRASQEIRQLEQEKSDCDAHAAALATALELRRYAESAGPALRAQLWAAAADAVRPWLEMELQENTAAVTANDSTNSSSSLIKCDPRVRIYTGEYALQQLSSTYQQLKTTMLQMYKTAVEQGDLRTLGELTPVLSKIHLEPAAVDLYLQFLKSHWPTLLSQDNDNNNSNNNNSTSSQPSYAPMARVYNAAVACLRHHLPLVSHYLYQADGDVAVVRLVHSHVEDTVLPLLTSYQSERQLLTVSRHAARIYALLEERYAGRQLSDAIVANELDDGGFSTQMGSLADVDSAMEEVAVALQQSECYLRFVTHTCTEVNHARRLRFDQEQKLQRLERERQGWTGRTEPPPPEGGDGHHASEGRAEDRYVPVQILSPFTPLHQAVAELGGQYAGIERCLLLASMQRAFVTSDQDARYYRPLTTTGSAAASAAPVHNQPALQTMVVDACLFAARRSTQRALATGHTGTASAMTNFCVDCLTGVLLDVLKNRAEESGIAALKPGEGLLGGATSLFHATNLIRHGNVASGVAHRHLQKEEALRKKQQATETIARACATLNDLEVAVYRTRQLEQLLLDTIDQGYAKDHHETEQLRLCVKSLRTVADSFVLAANSTIASLESVLTSRIRSIVGEAVGTEGSTAAGFMGSSVMVGGGKAANDRVFVRMNYKLDEEAYNMQQLSEGYMARLCLLLDDLLNPLRSFLAPRLWDTLLCNVLGSIAKRLEASLRKCEFTSLGALALDSDVRDLLSYAKERLHSPDFSSNVVITRACLPLARLSQISRLLSIDDLEDVLELISSLKRKNNWDLKVEETKAFLIARVEFDKSRINDSLRLPDDTN